MAFLSATSGRPEIERLFLESNPMVSSAAVAGNPACAEPVKHFVRESYRWIRSLVDRIGSMGLMVYQYLRECANPKRDKGKFLAWPSVAKVAAKIGKSEETVRRAMKRLVALGLVVVTPRTRRTNLVELVDVYLAPDGSIAPAPEAKTVAAEPPTAVTPGPIPVTPRVTFCDPEPIQESIQKNPTNSFSTMKEMVEYQKTKDQQPTTSTIAVKDPVPSPGPIAPPAQPAPRPATPPPPPVAAAPSSPPPADAVDEMVKAVCDITGEREALSGRQLREVATNLVRAEVKPGQVRRLPRFLQEKGIRFHIQGSWSIPKVIHHVINHDRDMGRQSAAPPMDPSQLAVLALWAERDRRLAAGPEPARPYVPAKMGPSELAIYKFELEEKRRLAEQKSQAT